MVCFRFGKRSGGQTRLPAEILVPVSSKQARKRTSYTFELRKLPIFNIVLTIHGAMLAVLFQSLDESLIKAMYRYVFQTYGRWRK